MKLFSCDHCGQVVYFENNLCEQCKYPLGFFAEDFTMKPLEKTERGTFRIFNNKESTTYKYCANHEYGVCNWVISTESSHSYCTACELNRTIPNLSKWEHIKRWSAIEVAKHRLIYSILRMKLPLFSKAKEKQSGLCFDFMADEQRGASNRILTGHDNGLITLNIAEADDVEREMARKAMDEVYRTVLGHFRHEVGHYYWDRLIYNSEWLEEFRIIFGDERKDYNTALQMHYKNGAPPNWNNQFISAYASVHPWEDWAETWAHYLHIIDTLETAYYFRLSVRPQLDQINRSASFQITENPYLIQDFSEIIQLWLPLTTTMNSLNRSMGQPDIYPFVISDPVVKKLSFIHRICYGKRVQVNASDFAKAVA